MGIEFQNVNKTFGGTSVVDDLSLKIDNGEFIVLLGPSGCGKTTTLRMLAGLESVTSGDIFINGEHVNDVPTQHRDLAMVFQSYALYPHMTIAENIGYPLRVRKLKKVERAERVKRVAAMLEIESLLERKPRQLSGGERQRVALARAIVREPRAYLMDEPLSNLDARLRVQMRGELKRLQHQLGTTTIYVTHDQAEAMTLASRVAVMKKGRLQQFDTPMNIYNHPANRFVAEFVGSPGMNFIEGRIDRGSICRQRIANPAQWVRTWIAVNNRHPTRAHSSHITAARRRDRRDCLCHRADGKRNFRFSFGRYRQTDCSRAGRLSANVEEKVWIESGSTKLIISIQSQEKGGHG